MSDEYKTVHDALEVLDRVRKMPSTPIEQPREIPVAGGELEVIAYAVFAKNGNIRCWSSDCTAVGLKASTDEGSPIIELVDRAHVTRLQAEAERLTQNCTALESARKVASKCCDILLAKRNALQAEVERLKDECLSLGCIVEECGKDRDALQSHLTKAREFIADAVALLHGEGVFNSAKPFEQYLAHQSTQTVCVKCGGSGEMDSGGVTPWDGWINIPCDCQSVPAATCATCHGTGLIDDGEMHCSAGGIPYENGPINCVKDCPECAPASKGEPATPTLAEQLGCSPEDWESFKEWRRAKKGDL